MLKGKNFHPTALEAINGASCATRMSNAFNRAGYDTLEDAFRNTDHTTVGDGLGNRYIMGAANLANHLRVASDKYLVTDLSSIQGQTGIIYFQNFHIDLFNGSEMVGNGPIPSSYFKNQPTYFMPLGN